MPLGIPVGGCDREADDSSFFFSFALLPHLPYEFVGARDGFAPATSAVEHSEPCVAVVELALSWMGFVSDAYCFLHTSGSSERMLISSDWACSVGLAPLSSASSMLIWRIRFKLQSVPDAFGLAVHEAGFTVQLHMTVLSLQQSFGEFLQKRLP